MKLYPTFSSLALALALTALTSLPLHASTGPGVSWQAAAADADIDRYFVQAKAEKKPVLLYWGAKWCPPCNQLKATLFNRADFIEQSKAFVAVGIDGDAPGAQKLGTRFKVRGYPTLILFSPAGPGHVLYLRSELTEGQSRIYSDNIALARWLQETVQGMLNPDLKNTSIPVIDAVFDKSGDMRSYWSEHVHAADAEIDLTWFDTGDPLLVHTQPNEPPQNRPYGVCTVLIPVRGTRLTLNGAQAKGQAWPREREGRPFSTCALAFSESWTEAR